MNSRLVHEIICPNQRFAPLNYAAIDIRAVDDLRLIG
jgi:hypothetical protein